MRQPESTFQGDAERTMSRDSPHTLQSSTMNTSSCTNKTLTLSVDTISAGDELAEALAVEQCKTWQALIENTDMTHNSNKAWSLIKKLSNDPRKADQHVNVIPNQVAYQLILNGKVPTRQRQSKIKRCGKENHDFDDDFTIVELQSI